MADVRPKMAGNLSALKRLILKMLIAVSSFLILCQITSELLEREVVINYSRRQLDPDNETFWGSVDEEEYQDDKTSSILGTMHNQVEDNNRTSVEKLIDIERSGSRKLLALFKDLVIVTAIAQSHLEVAKGMISSAQSQMPNTKILVYDLGLTRDGVNEVQKMCNVDLRRFQFELYPNHVKDVNTYAWRPLIIQETLKEFGVIFYADSSVRFLRSLRLLFPYLKLNHGFMQHIHNYNADSPYHKTDPQTFTELKVNRSSYINDIGMTPWISADRLLYVNSYFIQQNIIIPMVECALRSECICPEGARRNLTLARDSMNPPHGLDSSVLSLLVYKNMRGLYDARHNNRQIFDQTVSITGEFNVTSDGKRSPRNRPQC